MTARRPRPVCRLAAAAVTSDPPPPPAAVVDFFSMLLPVSFGIALPLEDEAREGVETDLWMGNITFYEFSLTKTRQTFEVNGRNLTLAEKIET